ncbi:hypothetical protein IC575_024296 [Cucumis melo]
MISFLPHLYRDPIYGVIRMTRDVPTRSLTRFEVYLRITCMVRGQLYYVYEVAHTTDGTTRTIKGVPTYYIYIMECVPVITSTTRVFSWDRSHDLMVFVRSHSLRLR